MKSLLRFFLYIGVVVGVSFVTSRIVDGPTVKWLPTPVTLEYTKNNELQPPVHIDGPTSIHIITGDDGKLIDVQLIPIK